VAYFLTFTTYGSWLHGDARGSKDREHNALGESPRLRDDILKRFETKEMRHAEVKISAAMRTAIEQAIAETCEYRGWLLLALNVRQQHVHVVVGSDGEHGPERVLTDLKAYATRALRARSLVASGSAAWSRHGSTHWLWNEQDVDSAIDYTLNYQGRDLPGAEWRKWRELLA
jgi:REP element-mobilizing transposase RayT